MLLTEGGSDRREAVAYSKFACLVNIASASVPCCSINDRTVIFTPA